MEDYIAKLRQRRIELGMTQEELAKRLGYSERSAIAKIETGVNELTVKKFVDMCRALSVDPADILGLEEK